MGHGDKSGPAAYHSIAENLADLQTTYPYRNGYFGTPGKSSDSSVRHIESDDPVSTVHDFYDRASYGGIEERLGEGKWRASMADGTVFTMREVSNSDGSPAVDINVRYSSNAGGVKQQKIHFTRGEGEDG